LISDDSKPSRKIMEVNDSSRMVEEIDSMSDNRMAEDTMDDYDDPTIGNNAALPSENDNIPLVPTLFTSFPAIRDDLVTTSSIIQDETVQNCLPYLAGRADPRKNLFDFSAHGVARLERDDHVRFLTDALQNARYMAYDAQRPWCVYWTLTGLSLLGEDAGPYQQRYQPPDPNRSYESYVRC
jgi:protein farnesyltransferase subunit beta